MIRFALFIDLFGNDKITKTSPLKTRFLQRPVTLIQSQKCALLANMQYIGNTLKVTPLFRCNDTLCNVLNISWLISFLNLLINRGK